MNRGPAVDAGFSVAISRQGSYIFLLGACLVHKLVVHSRDTFVLLVNANLVLMTSKQISRRKVTESWV